MGFPEVYAIVNQQSYVPQHRGIPPGPLQARKPESTVCLLVLFIWTQQPPQYDVSDYNVF